EDPYDLNIGAIFRGFEKSSHMPVHQTGNCEPKRFRIPCILSGGQERCRGERQKQHDPSDMITHGKPLRACARIRAGFESSPIASSTIAPCFATHEPASRRPDRLWHSARCKPLEPAAACRCGQPSDLRAPRLS